VHDFKKVKITEGKAKFPQCRTCKYDNVCEGPWREYPEKFGIDEFIPVNDEKKRKHIEINIGKACNNRCVFCMDGSNTKREFISTENLKKELKKLSEEGYNSLGFLGGEPTIYPKLDEIVAYAKSLGFNEIHIISNGRKFSDKKFTAKLIKSGVTRVSVSIHSDSAKIEDKLTTVKGSFDEKIKGLKNLAELRKEGTLKQDISINIVVNKSNIDCLIEIIKYFSALGMKDFRLNFVRPEGYALENFDSVVPKYTEFTKQIPFLIENAKKTEVRVHFGDIPYCTVKDIGKAREFFSESKDYFNDMITITDEERKRSSWENIRKDELKTKPEFCNECKYNSICEGPWKEYLKRIGKNEFKTIRT
jgi:radical SAM protein with 4Fe4S-binding SPASM domain